jgi:hypothetical protein
MHSSIFGTPMSIKIGLKRGYFKEFFILWQIFCRLGARIRIIWAIYCINNFLSTSYPNLVSSFFSSSFRLGESFLTSAKKLSFLKVDTVLLYIVVYNV